MGSPRTHVWAATLADIRARMRSNAKLIERRAKKVPAKGGHVPPVPDSPRPLALDPLVVMVVIRNNE